MVVSPKEVSLSQEVTLRLHVQGQVVLTGRY